MNDYDSIVKEGYLQKKSLHLHTFRQRWMVLKGNKLYSYKPNATDQNPTEIIDLNNFDNVSISKKGIFKLISAKATRIFLSPSITELNDWAIHIIKIILTANKTNQTDTKSPKTIVNKTNVSQISYDNTYNHLSELGLI
eukprot:309502_1